jgi:hypothetical protein
MDLQLADAPEDLFITEALQARPFRGHDHKREAKAIQLLAMRMADEPETVLPQFVELAMELTGAVSGGLSLWEREPAPGVFRWHFLRGTLARFNGATTPRNFSPCGVTLDRNRPTLTRRPGRFYSWIAEAGVEAPEVLLVPLYARGAEPFGTLWLVAAEEDYFDADHARLLGELGECVGLGVQHWRASASAG